MTQVFSKALKSTIEVSRIIGKVEGLKKGPTIVFFAGLHGNEPAGVFALREIINKIDPNSVNGCIYAICGNLGALKKSKRFIKKDLNRLWSQAVLDELIQKTTLQAEDIEQFEIFELIKTILSEHSTPFYFIDIHTTSSKTLPFITINDALINRKFSRNFPVPIILGIEEYLEGPLLTYLNTLGYVSLGFEAGQHDDEKAITNAMSFIYLVLFYSGSLSMSEVNLEMHNYQLRYEARHLKDVFEVIYLYQIRDNTSFQMRPHFESFQSISKGTPLAEHNNKTIYAPSGAKLFMPLYQNKGKEGFFLIKRIPPFFLNLSAFLRNIRADVVLVLLPGITWHDRQRGVLRVNLRTAKFMAKSLFHLLGYRSRIIDEAHVLLYNRERVAKTSIYSNCDWYKR